MMTKKYIIWLMEITLELDGHINLLNTETVRYQYDLERCTRWDLFLRSWIRGGI